MCDSVAEIIVITGGKTSLGGRVWHHNKLQRGGYSQLLYQRATNFLATNPIRGEENMSVESKNMQYDDFFP